MPRLIWVFTGCTVTLLVLSWGGSFVEHKPNCNSDVKLALKCVAPQFSLLCYCDVYRPLVEQLPLLSFLRNLLHHCGVQVCIETNGKCKKMCHCFLFGQNTLMWCTLLGDNYDITVHISLDLRKPVFWGCLTSWDSNRPAQLQKLAREAKFRI